MSGKISKMFYYSSACVCAKSVQLCLTLFDPMDCSPPGSSVHTILQARILELVTMPSSRDLPDPGIEPASLASSAIAGRFFSAEPPGKPNKSTVVKIISK